MHRSALVRGHAYPSNWEHGAGHQWNSLKLCRSRRLEDESVGRLGHAAERTDRIGSALLIVQNRVRALLLRRFVATRILSNAEIAVAVTKRLCGILSNRSTQDEKRPPVRRPLKRREGDSNPRSRFLETRHFQCSGGRLHDTWSM
jgi:hypothetical protein